jgi:23S rRNA (cytosine1962-C5)-methyltransferase
MASIKLVSGRKPRVLQGHPWIFGSEVQRLLAPDLDGTVVSARDAMGRPLGVGIYNGQSQIVWRRLSTDKIEWNAAFVRERILAAVQRRPPERVRRLIYSEADGLPGLIVDQYAHVVVVQCLTLAMDRATPWIVDSLREVLGVEAIVLRNDSPARSKEGLPLSIEMAFGQRVEPFWCRIGEIDFQVDLLAGQKTGAYLDQRIEYAEISKIAAGKRVLDLCCNQGGFALHAARAGALKVVGLDSSGPALAQAARNRARAGLVVDWVEANVFDWLRLHRKVAWDLVVLDPPPFAKSRAHLKEALQGYRDLNLRAMKVLVPGGILATYTCSHHVTHDLFQEMVAGLAGDLGREIRLLRRVNQPPDHPVLVNLPESEYFRGMILEIV